MAITVTTTCALGGQTATAQDSGDLQLPEGWSYVSVTTGIEGWRYLVCPDCLPNVRATVDAVFPHD